MVEVLIVLIQYELAQVVLVAVFITQLRVAQDHQVNVLQVVQEVVHILVEVVAVLEQ